MKKDLTERIFYRVTNSVLIFLMVNLYFLLMNFLFFACLLLFEPRIENTIIYLVALIPTGPAIAACFSAMGELIKEGEISATAAFFKGYKQNFKISLQFWLTQLLLILIFSFNYFYIRETMNLTFLLPLLLALLAGILFTNLYAFPILTRFNITVKNLWIISISSLYKYWQRSLLNAAITVTFLFLSFHHPLIIILSFASVIPYLIMYNLRNFLKELEDYY